MDTNKSPNKSQDKKKQPPSPSKFKLDDEPSSFFKSIEVEISFFESFTLLVSMFAMLEVGFFYTTFATMILATVAFYEMIQLQENRAKEDKIIVKSSYVDWSFYFTFQFLLTTKTWFNRALTVKSGLAPESGTLLFEVLFVQNNLVSFIFFTLSIMFFVMSLQEGFYAYQFKKLGWTLLSIFCIVVGSNGLIVALWSNRLWYVFAISSIVLHNVVDYIVSRCFPIKSPILMLKPEATLEGFLAGSVACFVYLFITCMYILETDWIK